MGAPHYGGDNVPELPPSFSCALLPPPMVTIHSVRPMRLLDGLLHTQIILYKLCSAATAMAPRNTCAANF